MRGQPQICQTELVKAFHEKHGFCVDEVLNPRPEALHDDLDAIASSQLEAAAVIVNTLAQQWRAGTSAPAASTFDLRLLRAHLILEEVAEALIGLARRDPVALLDGLADTAYVVAGTAVAYGLPLEDAFIEVHASNMTKRVADTDDPRLSKKGEGYVPPDLAAVIAGAPTALSVQ